MASSSGIVLLSDSSMSADIHAGLAIDAEEQSYFVERNEKGLFYALDLGGTNFRVLRVQIEPWLLTRKNDMIAAHGNSLRSIIMYLDKLTSQENILELKRYCCDLALGPISAGLFAVQCIQYSPSGYILCRKVVYQRMRLACVPPEVLNSSPATSG
ncbi:hypothetical protein DITRI_Ditri14bG0116300 [Diplodiscus trichospermus]